MKVSANKIKEIEDLIIIGSPIDKSDFWFWVPELSAGDGDKTVFHVTEGDGTNLDDSDEYEGAVDYLMYDAFDGPITYGMLDEYQTGNEEILGNFASDGGQVLLTSFYKDMSLKEICWRTLHFFGCERPEKYTVRILSGKFSDSSFSTQKKDHSGPIPARDIVIAAWAKNRGDFMKTLKFIQHKEPLTKDEIYGYVDTIEKFVGSLGGRVVTIIDQDYPAEFKAKKNPPFVFIEKDGKNFEI